jgi:regulator of replication initiation timing
MAVVNNGAVSQASEMFDLAMDLEEQVSHMMANLEQILDTLAKLVALYRS